MQDLTQFDVPDAPERLYLIHPSGGKLIDDETGEQLYLDAISSDHQKFRSLEHKQTTSRLKSARGGKVKITGEGLEDNATDLLVAALTGWHPNTCWDGEKKECNPQNKREFLTRFPTFRRQLDDFIHEETNYLGNSSKTSSPSPKEPSS